MNTRAEYYDVTIPLKNGNKTSYLAPFTEDYTHIVTGIRVNKGEFNFYLNERYRGSSIEGFLNLVIPPGRITKECEIMQEVASSHESVALYKHLYPNEKAPFNSSSPEGYKWLDFKRIGSILFTDLSPDVILTLYCIKLCVKQ